MPSRLFNRVDPADDWPLFTSVLDARNIFQEGTKIMVAIGGWGDDEGFEVAARTEESRELFARNVARMVKSTGADGEMHFQEYKNYIY
jgi:GH18 family chitinase